MVLEGSEMAFVGGIPIGKMCECGHSEWMHTGENIGCSLCKGKCKKFKEKKVVTRDVAHTESV